MIFSPRCAPSRLAFPNPQNSPRHTRQPLSEPRPAPKAPDRGFMSPPRAVRRRPNTILRPGPSPLPTRPRDMVAEVFFLERHSNRHITWTFHLQLRHLDTRTPRTTNRTLHIKTSMSGFPRTSTFHSNNMQHHTCSIDNKAKLPPRHRPDCSCRRSNSR